MNKRKPEISEAKMIIQQLLDDDEAYRRDAGIYGTDDMRTQLRRHRIENSMATLRWWFNTRFPQSR